MALAAKMKPPRDYPNMNAIHAVRGQWAVGFPSLSLPLTPGAWTQIGTIPANSFVTSAEAGVSIGALAAGATLDVGFGQDPTVPTQTVIAAQSLDTPGVFVAPDAAPGLGYRPNRTIVFAKLNSALPLTAGGFTAIISYYPKQD